jgi:hypothetical protein
MAKWDYKVERITIGFGGIKKLEEILNVYGDDGYELVTIDAKGVYIFKKILKLKYYVEIRSKKKTKKPR